MTRICTDNNQIKIREDQRNPRHPRSIIFLVLARPGWVLFEICSLLFGIFFYPLGCFNPLELKSFGVSMTIRMMPRLLII